LPIFSCIELNSNTPHDQPKQVDNWQPKQNQWATELGAELKLCQWRTVAATTLAADKGHLVLRSEEMINLRPESIMKRSMLAEGRKGAEKIDLTGNEQRSLLKGNNGIALGGMRKQEFVI
jgi:hypothetical protein